MSDALIEKWRSEAEGVNEPDESADVPVDVLFGEAIDLVGFIRHNWEPQLDGRGQVVRPGLSQVNTEEETRISPTIATEIDELQQASSRAHTLFLLASGGKADDLMGRATAVLSDITATLEFVFDDGRETVEDVQLARLRAANEQPTSQDAMALALNQYASMADEHRDLLDGLGTFDIGTIDLARELAAALLDRSAPKGDTAAQQAMKLRNQLWTLLQARMKRVRSVARYVFRMHPEIARGATSSYQRRQRAELRRRKQATTQ
jgi:hypothetical protein